MAENLMEKVVNLTKRRGFIFPSSEIYGGTGSLWDYGPLGVLLKNNIKSLWWQKMIQERDDIVGLDASILMNRKVWEASGHTKEFSDPLVDCKKCHKRYRADHLLSLVKGESGEVKEIIEKVDEHALAENPNMISDLNALLKDIKCPDCGGDLTDVRQFNLMFKTFMGPIDDDSGLTYLRPETAQGIFVNFKNILSSNRLKIPFGIAQIGKSFRNEITTGNYIFRSLEFEQMELEFFVNPKDADKWYQNWVKEREKWYIDLGIRRENLRLRPHEKDELAHYAKAATDVEYHFPFGWSELEGIANRQDYDLKQHQEYSGKDLTYFDEETKDKYLPFVIEPSGGVDRTLLAFLVDAYKEYPSGRNKDKNNKEGNQEAEVVLHLHPKLAPIKAAILPLVKKEKLPEMAKEIQQELRKNWFVDYDESGSIGRRYRRQDEIGTPWCVTIDFQSLQDKTVTIRDRETMKQTREKIDSLRDYFLSKI